MDRNEDTSDEDTTNKVFLAARLANTEDAAEEFAILAGALLMRACFDRMPLEVLFEILKEGHPDMQKFMDSGR